MRAEVLRVVIPIFVPKCKGRCTPTIVYSGFQAVLPPAHEAQHAIRNMPSKMAANDKSKPEPNASVQKLSNKEFKTSGSLLFLTSELIHTVVAQSKTHLSKHPTCLRNNV